MTKYSISNKTSGQFLGTYDAASDRDAVDAMHRDAGYSGSSEAARVLGQSEDALFGDLCVQEADIGRVSLDNADRTRASRT